MRLYTGQQTRTNELRLRQDVALLVEQHPNSGSSSDAQILGPHYAAHIHTQVDVYESSTLDSYPPNPRYPQVSHLIGINPIQS